MVTFIIPPTSLEEMVEFPELMTIRETAAYLRMPLPTIYYDVTRGIIPAVQIGGRWRVKKSLVNRDVLRYSNPEVTAASVIVQVSATEVSKRVSDLLVGTDFSLKQEMPVDQKINQNETVIVDSDALQTAEMQDALVKFKGKIICIVSPENFSRQTDRKKLFDSLPPHAPVTLILRDHIMNDSKNNREKNVLGNLIKPHKKEKDQFADSDTNEGPMLVY